MFFRYMKRIHCASQVTLDNFWKHSECARDSFLHENPFLDWGGSQNVIYHIIAMAGMSDTDTKSIEIGSIDASHDIAQAIVSAMPSSLLETRDPRRQIDLIVDDQYSFRRIAIIMENSRYGQAAFIHEGSRLEKAAGSSVNRDFALIPKEFCAASKSPLEMGCESIHEPKTGIVACHGITRSRVS
uniref:Uncharacterized protein n=1 Tax=Candidatus Kentrum sp. SD TaxID=2126332 RepID=A0A451BLW1_9GAMM|nr:MAG: hypothetical protein BECKSD772F_GA0070984_10392 [Candidatus Kentron sp. SD]VFK43677.1 MAG: hypothetical protein BECKSD772E_GA0070983_10286 [Candidatus Kentron sp. SD]VFK79253.1 MAG: hypothetical protein BECKSD772D_GA0070982_10426 [Candidatus Kentron sp. SD]